MKNIPVFTTEAGVASLVLEEIPYKRVAYIKIQSSLTPDKLIKECVDFCRMAGAEKIYASGHDYLSKYPFHTEMIRMECDKSLLPLTQLKFQRKPIDTESVALWCDIYNKRMHDVPNAATLSVSAVKELISANVCFLIYEGQQLLGIGKIVGNKVDAVATVVPGRGADVMCALCSVIKDESILVEVAVNNIPAIKLYEKLGFQKKNVISTWYCVNKL